MHPSGNSKDRVSPGPGAIVPGAYTGTGSRLQTTRYDKDVQESAADHDIAAAPADVEVATVTITEGSRDPPQANGDETNNNEGPAAAKPSKNKHLILGIIGIIVILVLVALVLLLVFLLQGDSSSEDQQVTSTNDSEINEEGILKLFPNTTLQALKTKDSPQAKAYQWLLEDLPQGQYSNARIVQRFALSTFYHSLGGQRWKDYEGWLDHDKKECTWLGLECDDQDDAVHTIVLAENRLKGTLPEELCLLKNITTVDLPNNFIRGYFPFCLLENKQVFAIDLNGNPEVGLPLLATTHTTILSHLRVLNMPFAGRSDIPTQVGLLSSLEVISLSDRGLRGKIPSEIGNLSELHTIDLSSNRLRGGIPTELGALTSSLKNLRLGRNFRLRGSIPSELGGLRSLEKLVLGSNALSGSIPSDLGGLEVIRTIDLTRNNLTSSVPSELGGLQELKKLDLSRNELTGTIPSELGSPKKTLSQLELQKNSLSGSIPSELGTINIVYLYNNRLAGRVPVELNRTGVLLGGNANLTGY